jgi:outer membrane protein assembly factor BamA
MPWLSRRAGIAMGVFADAGRIWAGDVPYGVTTPMRASVGFSLMGSYPVSSKRMYRLDVGFPLNPARFEQGIAFRLTSGDRTGLFWSEPSDVERARAGTGPVSLMRW